MKKMLFLIFMLLFFSFDLVTAKTIGSVSCKYDVYSIHNTTSGYLDEYKLTSIYVVIDDYSDETAETTNLLYLDNNDTWLKLNYTTSNVVSDWKYTGTDTYPYDGSLSLFAAATKKNKLKKFKGFYDSYVSSGSCPVIYSNLGTNGNIVIDTYVIDTTNALSTSVALKPVEELLKEPGSNTWLHKSEFYKSDDGGSTLKEDLVCNYDLEFDMYNIKTPVEFRTVYNPNNSSKTYKITLNGNVYSYTDLNEDVFLTLGQGNGDLVFISSEELNKIFLDGKCLDRTKLYHYYDMSWQRYTITTDKNEASENGAGGRYDNGDGSNDGDGGSTKPGGGVSITDPDFDLSGGSATCAELLGPNLMKVVSFAITTLRIIGSIMAIVIGMTKLIPAVTKGDQGELSQAIKTCVWMAVVLILIIVLPILLKTIGNLFGLDITCIP